MLRLKKKNIDIIPKSNLPAVQRLSLRSIVISALLLGIVAFDLNAGVQKPDTKTSPTSYKEGREARKAGKYEKALKIWLESSRQTYSSNVVDPRTGFAFIELATEQDMRQYYKTACHMYYGALETGSPQKFKEGLKQEVKRLKPLVDNRKFHKWRRGITDSAESRTILREIKQFWQQADPTPDTRYNERLIEHWERIAYARKNFNESRHTVYGTDERAQVYIKFGKPDKSRKGTVGFNRQRIQGWATDLLMLNDRGVYTTGNVNMGSGGEGQSLNKRMMRQSERDAIVKNLLKRSRHYHRYGNYDIWVYRNLGAHGNDNTLYIFGNDGDTGEFKMLKSVEEMIPRSAFRRNQYNGITPGLLLQMMHYDELAMVDQQFSSALHQLQGRAFDMNGLYRELSRNIEDEVSFRIEKTQSSAPEQKSSYVARVDSIPMDIKQYRMLSENNRPYLMTFMFSRPQKHLLNNVFNAGSGEDATRLLHTLVLRDSLHNPVTNKVDTPMVILDNSKGRNKLHPAQSYFVSPHLPHKVNQSFVARVSSGPASGSVAEETAFDNNLQALGSVRKSQPDPLSVDTSRIEMSDLILGYTGEQVKARNFPFQVAYDRLIPAQQNMMVRFEVYHLQEGSSDRKEFELSYKVRPLNKNWLGRKKLGSPEVELTLNYETLKSQYEGMLEIETSNMEPGEYELQLEALDKNTDRKKERKVRFELIKGGSKSDS